MRFVISSAGQVTRKEFREYLVEDAFTELFGVVLEAQSQFGVPVEAVDADGQVLEPLGEVLEFFCKKDIESAVDFDIFGINFGGPQTLK